MPVRQRTGKRSAATTVSRAAETPASKAAAAVRQRITDLVARAEAEFGDQQYTAVVATVAEALRLDPGHGPALALLGLVAHRGRKLDVAAEYLVAAAAAAPADPLIRRRFRSRSRRRRARRRRPRPARRGVRGRTDRSGRRRRPRRRPSPGRAAGACPALRRPRDRHRSGPPAARSSRVTLDMQDGRLAEARAGYERLAVRSSRPDLADHRIVVAPVSGVREWALGAGDAYTVVEPAAPITIARPHYAGEPTAPQPLAAIRPEAWVASCATRR